MENINQVYVCPKTKGPLKLIVNEETSYFLNQNGIKFKFSQNIPNLTYPIELSEEVEKVKTFYDSRADDYDKFIHLTFFTHEQDEQKCRNEFIKTLNIKAGDNILEIAAGTGRDSELIAQTLRGNGSLYLQDLSPKMLKKCETRLSKYSVGKTFCISNASYLPYPDNFFHATYSFGGLGEFGDIKKSLKEMVRVTKVGGKIVVGDESMPTWLRHTYFAKVLTTTNPQFSAKVPLKDIPVEARDVCLRWVLGGVFYLIDFSVGEGEPHANIDFEIPGVRGGTYRTRFEGQLEGVSPEAKELAYRAIEKKGISMHKWLDNVIKDVAKKDLL